MTSLVTSKIFIFEKKNWNLSDGLHNKSQFDIFAALFKEWDIQHFWKYLFGTSNLAQTVFRNYLKVIIVQQSLAYKKLSEDETDFCTMRHTNPRPQDQWPALWKLVLNTLCKEN